MKELNLSYSQIGGRTNPGSSQEGSKGAAGSKTRAGSLNKTFTKGAGEGMEAGQQ